MLAISIKDLVKTYPHIGALKGITLDIKKGEFFALLGPNGAGKQPLPYASGCSRPDTS
ncbi:MAG: hypothetical protein AABY40_00310 [Nanoarchaeota archaeon]